VQIQIILRLEFLVGIICVGVGDVSITVDFAFVEIEV